MRQQRWQLVLVILVVAVVAACDRRAATNGAADRSSEVAGSSRTTSDGAAACVDVYDPSRDYFPDKVSAEYSEQWQVEYGLNYKILRVDVPTGVGDWVLERAESTYVLVKCGTPAPELSGDLADATVIEIPIETAVDGDDGLYGTFEHLGVAESFLGYAGLGLTELEAEFLPGVYAQMQAGRAPQLGYEINIEQLADIEPDVLFKNLGDEGLFDQIRGLGIPIVFYTPYQETPMGSAEQIKFLSLFFNLEREAAEHFAGVEARYGELRELASSAPGSPTVLLGSSRAGRSFSARQNDYYEARLLADANAINLPDLPGDGFATIAMENVIDVGGDADFWFNLSLFPGETVADFIASDPRAASIEALEGGNAFHRFGARGQDYSFTGKMNPDVVLADLITILHPDLLPDRELVYLARIPTE